MQGPELYTTACAPLAQHSHAAEMSTRRDLVPDQLKDEIERSMEVPEGVPSYFKLRSQLVNKLNHIGDYPTKGAIMRGVQESLTGEFEPSFQPLTRNIYCFDPLLGGAFNGNDLQWNSGHLTGEEL